MVMEQIANLSTGNCRQGSNPCLSAQIEKASADALAFFMPNPGFKMNKPKVVFVKSNVVLGLSVVFCLIPLTIAP